MGLGGRGFSLPRRIDRRLSHSASSVPLCFTYLLKHRGTEITAQPAAGTNLQKSEASIFHAKAQRRKVFYQEDRNAGESGKAVASAEVVENAETLTYTLHLSATSAFSAVNFTRWNPVTGDASPRLQRVAICVFSRFCGSTTSRTICARTQTFHRLYHGFQPAIRECLQPVYVPPFVRVSSVHHP